MAKKRTVWVGVIPGIFGYGISVAEESEEACMKALNRAYREWKKGYPDPTTNFKTSFEYWGGRVTEVELGKNYFDNFGE
jgi:ribosomal protein S5